MQFERAIGIDYSGAETADSSLNGLRVYLAQGDAHPVEVGPPPGAKRYWTRRALADWVIARLADPVPTIVGVDHAFSFPEPYFARHGLARDWDAFLDDFHAHWPTDAPNLYVDFLRHGRSEAADARRGETSWRRRVEMISRAKSVFHFDVQGQVAKSTHAGLPFLRRIRRALPQLHVWPFDGWSIPTGRSALVEAYPKLYAPNYPSEGRSADQHDAYATARWLNEADRDGRLIGVLKPVLSDLTRRLASYEGWIVGVVDDVAPERSAQARVSSTRTRMDRGTTQPGYLNPNGQVVIAATGLPGTDHNQRVYHLCCGKCGHNYGANGSDIHARRCPNCGGGRPGLPY